MQRVCLHPSLRLSARFSGGFGAAIDHDRVASQRGEIVFDDCTKLFPDPAAGMISRKAFDHVGNKVSMMVGVMFPFGVVDVLKSRGMRFHTWINRNLTRFSRHWHLGCCKALGGEMTLRERNFRHV